MMSSYKTTCCGIIHQTIFYPICRKLNPELDCDTLTSIAKQCMERASVLALQKPVISHSVRTTHDLQSTDNGHSNIISSDSVAQTPLSVSSNPYKPGFLRRYATRLFRSLTFAQEDLSEKSHAQSFEQQTQDFFPARSPGTGSLLAMSDVPRTSEPEAPSRGITSQQQPTSSENAATLVTQSELQFMMPLATSSATPVAAISQPSNEDIISPFLMFQPLRPLPAIDHDLSFRQKVDLKQSMTGTSITGKIRENSIAPPTAQSSFSDIPSFFDTPVNAEDPPSPLLNSANFQGIRAQARGNSQPDSLLSQPSHGGQASADRQQVRPTESLSGDLEPLQGQLYLLRPKVWYGLSCHSCPQNIQAAKKNQHPNGFCQKQKTGDTANYFEVLLHAVSTPDISSRCNKCIAVGNDRASENHTTSEHGMARWYDHPDNSPIPDKWILFYNPCPGLENEKSKHNARSDIPPLHLLKKYCHRSMRHQMIKDWKQDYEIALKSLNPGANPDVALISRRYKRWRREMYKKARKRRKDFRRGRDI